MRVTKQMDPDTRSTCPSASSRYDGTVIRAGSPRVVVNRYAYDGATYVGRLVTVAAPDPLAGLIVWVTIEPALHGRGFGAALHAAVQRDLGSPLILDTAVVTKLSGHHVPTTPAYPGWDWFQDRVDDAEYRVWDTMIRHPGWYVRHHGGRFWWPTTQPLHWLRR